MSEVRTNIGEDQILSADVKVSDYGIYIQECFVSIFVRRTPSGDVIVEVSEYDEGNRSEVTQYHILDKPEESFSLIKSKDK